MIENNVNVNPDQEVDDILANQRDESDARSIINEVEFINSLKGGSRFRWIWELLQNARDEANGDIEIQCQLADDLVSFTHNGNPFLSDNLLALIRKTSTKPISGIEGKAGKFGTGFITTHLLNKKVNVKGVHKNNKGLRRFEIQIDRSPDDLQAMRQAIETGIDHVKEINRTDSIHHLDDLSNTFSFQLKTEGHEIANGGMDQLENNVLFTLLINKQIKKVEIISNSNKRTYEVGDNLEGVCDGISFMQLINGGNSSENEEGLLYLIQGDLIIASPVIMTNDEYFLQYLDNRVRLYKDLPLIGTEEFYIPAICQHKLFRPNELRDGVRTKVSPDINVEDDKIAYANRNALIEFVNAFPEYLKSLYENNIHNLHLLAETGLPPNVEQYYDINWFTEFVQTPLRKAIQKLPIVKTVSGDPISIEDAKFIVCDSDEYIEDMYKLVSRLYPDSCPDSSSYLDWHRIINQEIDNWPEGITINIEDLVEIISDKEEIVELNFSENSIAVEWLQDLVKYLENTGDERLGKENKIYPNQENKLVTQNDICHDTQLDPRFKRISEGMGRRLEEELLPTGFEANFVDNFDDKTFLNELNVDIGNLNVEEAIIEQVQAVIDVCCTFKKTKAERREQWYDLLHRLLPKKATTKYIIDLQEEYQWEPAEKCSLKYVSYLIQESKTFSSFTETYFNLDNEKAYKWLNDYFKFAFRNEDNKEAALRYEIVPTQDGNFRKYEDNIFCESDSELFDDEIKNLYEQYVDDEDPRSFIVDNCIRNDYFRKGDLDKISSKIDTIFNSQESEDKVKEGGEYHGLFLSLKEWADEKPDISRDYFPIFSEKQPVLYIKAFGAGSKVSRLLKIKKPIEEIEKLDKLTLGADDLTKLDTAVSKLGSIDPLLDKADEMIEQVELALWRKTVGDAAENAFLEALAEAEPTFPEPDNPDKGRDFVIKSEKLNIEFSIEIKSAVEGKETVQMSIPQGEAAVDFSDSYALCVVSRPVGELTTKEQFIEKARFVPDIGNKIGNKIANWRNGVRNVDIDGEISVNLDSKTGGVNIRKSVWCDKLSFHEFVHLLRKHFELEL